MNYVCNNRDSYLQILLLFFHNKKYQFMLFANNLISCYARLYYDCYLDTSILFISVRIWIFGISVFLVFFLTKRSNDFHFFNVVNRPLKYIVELYFVMFVICNNKTASNFKGYLSISPNVKFFSEISQK